MANLLSLLLLLSLSGFAVALAKQIDQFPDTSRPVRPAPVRPLQGLPPSDTFTLPALDEFSQTRERPLFADNRRPPIATAPVTPVQAKAPLPPTPAKRDPAGITLTAIVIVGKDRVALLRTSKASTTRRLRVGDKVNGWRVDSIGPDAVVITLDDERKTLPLRHFGPPPPPQPLTPVPVPKPAAKRPVAKARPSISRRLLTPGVPPKAPQPR